MLEKVYGAISNNPSLVLGLIVLLIVVIIVLYVKSYNIGIPFINSKTDNLKVKEKKGKVTDSDSSEDEIIIKKTPKKTYDEDVMKLVNDINTNV